MTTISLNPQGLAFARYAKALCMANNDVLVAEAYGEGRRYEWASTPDVHRVQKAAVAALSSGNAADLTVARPITTDFLALIRARSVLDRIVGLRQVPVNISMLKTTAGASTAWVAQGAPRPISRFSFDRVALTYDKICSSVVLTRELLYAGGLVAEMTFARELAAGVAAFTDRYFLDPAFDAIADTRPASITFGLPSISSSGATLAAVQSDLQRLFANFVAADGALEAAAIVMAPRTALSMAQLTGTGGAPAFPNLGVKGGSLFGVPVLTSSACLADGSPGETFMVLFDPQQVLIADDGDLSVKAARHAAVQMSDTPVAGATTLVSLWQNDLVALGVDRSIVWKRSADAGVAVLRDINY